MRPAGWPGRGRLGEGSPNRVGSATRKWLPRSLGCGPELPPPCVPLPPQQGSGDAEAGECPRSQNMSTAQDGRRAAGASEGTAQIFGRPPEPRAPLSHHKSALSIKKGRTATLRTAAITPRESERATTVQALFRVLPKCPAILPGPRSPVGDRPLLTCLSLSAAIRGCLSWSCFLRSPFYEDTEERAQPGRPGGGGRAGEPRAPHPHHPLPGGPSRPQRAPTFRDRFPHTGHRAMSREAAYLWLPPHWGSSRGGAGAEATRRRAPSRASLQAGVRVRVSVRVCAGGGGTNKEPSKHGESVSSKAHKYSSRVLISPTHTRARRNITRAPAASRRSHNRQTTFANSEGRCRAGPGAGG